MFEKFIIISTNYLVHRRVIDEEDRDIYEYGFHALYKNTLDIASIVIIALLFNKIPQMIVYHISFIALRNTAGGYHAKTHLRCFIMSTIHLLVSLIVITKVISSALSMGLACLSILLIWIKAPIEHENNPMCMGKHNRMKALSRTFSVIFLCSIFMINVFVRVSLKWVAMSLALGMASHAILLLAAIAQISHNRETF